MEYTFILYALLYVDLFAASALICVVLLFTWLATVPGPFIESVTRRGAYTPWPVSILIWTFIAIPVVWVVLYFMLELRL